MVLAKGHPDAVIHDCGTCVAIRYDGWPWEPTPDNPDPGSWHGVGFAPKFTASIDASLALVERCGFPLGQGKWNYTMAAAYGSFSIIPNDPNSTGIHDKRCGHAHGAPTIPLAILIALLSAIEASNAQ